MCALSSGPLYPAVLAPIHPQIPELHGLTSLTIFSRISLILSEGTKMPRVEKNRVRSSRSRPVSCHFCRSRKLKCSRIFPCSNCTSREKTCQLYPTPPPPASLDDQTDKSASNSHTDVLARLQRLEEIVIANGPASSPSETFETANPPGIIAPFFGSTPLSNHKSTFYDI
ncbi:hypothetical protein N7475_005313 [Penicillium sp. IBT 31633x]|nr:hypothetical protein N7475_005313 [Penicillium sp. IBT 31633x]